MSVTSSEEGREEKGEGQPPVAVAGLRRTRRALWIAVAVAVPVAMLIVVLAVQPPAGTRQAKSPLVGKAAPAAAGTTIDGAEASLADVRGGGKWVVVNFFATWCVPCRLEHPDLVRFAEQHTTIGDAAVMGIVFGDNTQAVKEFRDEEGGDWPMLTDPSGRTAIDFGVAGVPESFLVDPEGKVVAKIVGGIRAPDLDRLLADAKRRGKG